MNIGLRRATFLILKKEPLNVHFQGSKFELCGASFNGGLLMYVYLFKQIAFRKPKRCCLNSEFMESHQLNQQ